MPAEARHEPAPGARFEGWDALVALGLALVLYLLYAASFQARQFGDGPLLLQVFTMQRDGGGNWGHVLYMPVAGALWGSGLFSSPVAVLRFLSSGMGALAIGLAYLLCRALDVPRLAAVAAVLLLGLSPGWWFFATTFEVHALHAACVGLCVLVTLLAPWRHAVLSVLLVAACLPLVFLSHQSGLLLGLGFVFLSQFARVRSGQPAFSWPVLLGVIGPLYLASFGAAIAIAVTLEETTVSAFFGASNDLIETFDRGFGLANVVEGWLQPLALILPLALLAVGLRRLRGLPLGTAAAMVLPSLIFFLGWGLPERGGYALGTAAVWCAVAACLLPRSAPRALLVGGLLVVVQAGLGWTALRSFDTPVWRELLDSRARAVERALPEGGMLISINPRFQYIEAALPDVFEKSLYPALAASQMEGRTPTEFAAEAGAQLELWLAESNGRAAIDLSYRELIGERATFLVPYVEAFDALLLTRYALQPYDDPDWSVARIR